MNASDLKTSIVRRVGNAIEGLEVVLVGENVFIRGSTESWYNKQLAGHSILNLCTCEIVNEIKVETKRK